MMLIAAATILILIAIALLWLSHRQTKLSGMPGGRVVYSDMGDWSPPAEPFYDQELRLTGKPDYLVAHGGQIIPVEVKSSQGLNGPIDAHIYQLASYCLLVDRKYHHRPPYGILRYTGTTYRIDYTRQLESAILDLIAELHKLGSDQQRHRSHNVKARCAGCGYRSICTQCLA